MNDTPAEPLRSARSAHPRRVLRIGATGPIGRGEAALERAAPAVF